MTQSQLIELVKQHFPNATDTLIRIHLNNVFDEFCRETEIVEDFESFSTVDNTRWYDLDSKIISVKSVSIENDYIPRLIGKPQTQDIT